MDLESVRTNMDIASKVVGQWQRTGRLNEIERAFLLDKLKEIYDAVKSESEVKAEVKAEGCTGGMFEAEGGQTTGAVGETTERTDGASAEQTANSTAGQVVGENETPSVSFTVEQFNTTESVADMETNTDKAAKNACNDGIASENKEVWPPVTPNISRRGVLDKKTIRSLYDDSQEELSGAVLTNTADRTVTESAVSNSDDGHDSEHGATEHIDTETQTMAATQAAEVQDPIAIDKKVVLGEIINQGRQTVGETITPQIKKMGVEKISDLRKAIGVNDKYLMVRDLFKGDADAFDAALTQLNDFTDLDDAMLFIHDNYQWNYNSDASRLLVDMIVRKLM